MDPKRGITVVTVQVGSRQVSEDSQVWVWDSDESLLEIECRGQRGRVPRSAVAFSPVPAPTLAVLQRLDACFGGASELFEVEHQDPTRYFSIERCKAHQRRFLRSSRGGVAMYERLTLLEERDDGAPDDVWNRYHAMSNNWLNWLGRSL
ncbi:MAG TPA: hypothetical protein VGL19_14930 [Polyangiaceae bacterium]|jgi:hypothetical protein